MNHKSTDLIDLHELLVVRILELSRLIELKL